MLNFLYKNKPRDKVTIPAKPSLGLFHVVFTRSQQPTPGTEDMAYRSLALPKESPVGAATVPQQAIRATAKPVVQMPTTMTEGLPTQAGTVRLQPLFDPSTGNYNRGFTGIDNIPYRRHEIAPAGVAL
jgi:hypothetical protein